MLKHGTHGGETLKETYGGDRQGSHKRGKQKGHTKLAHKRDIRIGHTEGDTRGRKTHMEGRHEGPTGRGYTKGIHGQGIHEEDTRRGQMKRTYEGDIRRLFNTYFSFCTCFPLNILHFIYLMAPSCISFICSLYLSFPCIPFVYPSMFPLRISLVVPFVCPQDLQRRIYRERCIKEDNIWYRDEHTEKLD